MNDAPIHDDVNNPEHYKTDSGIECIDAIEASMTPEEFQAFCRGNIIKYAWRANKKGSPAKDLRKASWYANKCAESIEKQEASFYDDFKL